MDLWYSEQHRHTRLSFKVRQTLYHAQTNYQTVDILETWDWGRVLLLDGLVMLTERDEFAYHEMIAHVPLMAHPRPQRVLIVGGGDGGTLREVVRHPGIEAAHLCEIDGEVVEACRRFFPSLRPGFDHPAARVFIEDGTSFVRETDSGSYDVVIVDSTDPVGAAEGLVEEGFYREVRRILGEGGIFVQQTESPWVEPDVVRRIYAALRGVFRKVACYLVSVPTYPSGTWSFAFASASADPIPPAFDPTRWEALRAGGLRYYTPDIHRAAFALPPFAAELTT